jgi:hypothetical protein
VLVGWVAKNWVLAFEFEDKMSRLLEAVLL